MGSVRLVVSKLGLRLVLIIGCASLFFQTQLFALPVFDGAGTNTADLGKPREFCQSTLEAAVNEYFKYFTQAPKELVLETSRTKELIGVAVKMKNRDILVGFTVAYGDHADIISWAEKIAKTRGGIKESFWWGETNIRSQIAIPAVGNFQEMTEMSGTFAKRQKLRKTLNALVPNYPDKNDARKMRAVLKEIEARGGFGQDGLAAIALAEDQNSQARKTRATRDLKIFRFDEEHPEQNFHLSSALNKFRPKPGENTKHFIANAIAGLKDTLEIQIGIVKRNPSEYENKPALRIQMPFEKLSDDEFYAIPELYFGVLHWLNERLIEEYPDNISLRTYEVLLRKMLASKPADDNQRPTEGWTLAEMNLMLDGLTVLNDLRAKTPISFIVIPAAKVQEGQEIKPDLIFIDIP